MSACARLLPLLALAAPLFGCIERPGDDRTETTPQRARAADALLDRAPAVVRFPSGANFDDLVELVGTDVQPEQPAPGGRVAVTFYWRVLEDVRSDWKIFVHVSEPGGTPKVNADHWPVQDRLRTHAWRRGDVVKDTFQFTLPREMGKRAELWTGFYAGKDRMPVTSGGRGGSDGQNRVRAAVVPLR